MGASDGLAAFESLKVKASKLKEENERLEKQGNQLEKEIQQLKVEGAQAQARNVAAKAVASFHFYSAQFPEPMNPVALRSSADAIRKTEPEAIIFLSDAQGFCVATSGGTAQKKGILADALLKLSTEIAGGSGGGRSDMAQGRIKEPSKFLEVEGRLVRYIEERVK
ncbi:MAG: hypothetical protein HY211_01770 [Candidatus Omnitrophica bacterium]|nr:hypothetical protein [Candidatus Omnitrophota bacterium]